MNNALGMIEVIGYIAAVEAADAAVKAANVELLGVEKITDGIVVVKLVGDVGAVKAAVEVGTLAAESVGRVSASHVIPRIHQEVSSIVKETMKKEVIVNEQDVKVNEEPVEPEVKESLEENLEENLEEDLDQTKQTKMDREILAAMSVVTLKDLIKSLAIPMTAKKLKTAKKEELINLLLKFYKEDDQ